MGASFFRIHFHQSQVRPDALNQIIYAVGLELAPTSRGRQMGLRRLLEVLLGANYHRVVLAGQLRHLLEADRIYFIVHIWANGKGKKLSDRLSTLMERTDRGMGCIS